MKVNIFYVDFFKGTQIYSGAHKKVYDYCFMKQKFQIQMCIA